MTKVLVFESDASFAGELRNELGRLGCTIQVVDDGNVGLTAATTDRPDLILLSIELPRMNGFSVCNKLKKDPQLKDVPLLIMSSESSEETFEQHKKLRTRAEDYVHKPIAFGELLGRIQALVPGIGGGQGQAEDDDAIVIDDEAELLGEPDEEEATGILDVGPGTAAHAAVSTPPPVPARRMSAPPASPAASDAEIDTFLGDAFDRMTSDEDGEERATNPPPAPLPAIGASQSTAPQALSSRPRAPSFVPAPAPSPPPPAAAEPSVPREGLLPRRRRRPPRRRVPRLPAYRRRATRRLPPSWSGRAPSSRGARTRSSASRRSCRRPAPASRGWSPTSPIAPTPRRPTVCAARWRS
jgi:CheY-like chemotaxis protein